MSTVVMLFSEGPGSNQRRRGQRGCDEVLPQEKSGILMVTVHDLPDTEMNDLSK